MPKIFLTENQKRDDAFVRLVKSHMAQEGVFELYKLADRLKIKRSTLSSKMNNPDTFKKGELRMLCKTLKIAPEEIATVI